MREGLFLLALSAGFAVQPLPAQLAPDQALGSMKPAPGLEVSLFATEPDLVNPTCMDIDPEGRVWVCEGVNYRGKAHPPHRKTGDRIVVLEDTDGDGRADRSRTFYQGLDLEAPLGILWLGDRIYVSQSPRIFSIEIRPDGSAGEKRDFLTGFKGVNHDHGVHSLILGPDGLLYGAFGNEGADVTDRSGRRIRSDGRPYFGGMVFRCTLDGSGLEVLAHNFRNNYECALDSFGTIFQSDNDDDGNQWVRFIYVMQGGNYGYLGPTGRHWSEEKKSHWHLEDPGVAPLLVRTGGGSPTGLCVYEGRLLPERYRGMCIHADAGPRVVQCFRLKPLGAGYHLEEAPLDENGRQTVETLSRIVKPEVVLTSSDTWFRPSDVAVAPDGSLLVADWYDPGVGGHGMGDTSRGRIYRLTPAGERGYRPPPLDLSSEEGILRALGSPALSVRSLASLKLREMGPKPLGSLSKLARSGEAVERARALWLLWALPAGRALAEETLRAPDPRFRVLGVRALKENDRARFLELTRPLRKDPDPQVRREILLELRDVAGDEAARAIAELAGGFDGHDRFYLAAIGIASRGREDAVFRKLKESWGGAFGPIAASILWELRPPEAAPFLSGLLKEEGRPEAERVLIARALVELDGEPPALAILDLLESKAGAELKREAASLIASRLGSRWRFLSEKKELARAAEGFLTSDQLAPWGVKLAAAGRLRALRPSLERMARERAVSDPLRPAAVQALAALDDPASVPLLAELARSEAAPASEEAVAALGRMSGAAPVEALRAILLETASPSLRSSTVKALGGSRSGAILLVKLAQENELPEAARALATTVVHSSGYEEVRLLGAKSLPRPRAKGGKDLPPPAELLAQKGDPARGEKAFFDEGKGNCGRCHRVKGRGNDVGPELSVIGGKLGRDALLESILSPSASISHEYKVWILQTRSAGFVTGTIADETGDQVTVRDANGKRMTFKKSDVTARTPSEVSLMPEGLAGSMTAGDLMDIVDFLARERPAGTAAGAARAAGEPSGSRAAKGR
jgi:putative membrane-bound dehydrogenase-like protein